MQTIGMAASMLILVAAGQPPWCKAPKPAQLSVTPTTKEITYDYSKSLNGIQDVHIDGENPFGIHTATVTQGFMQGAIKITPKVSLGYRINQTIGQSCLWYDTVAVGIEIDPAIVIAQEVAADPCMKQAVLDHEMKHINTDRALVNSYSQTIGTAVQEALTRQGFLIGPIPAAQAEARAQSMQDLVFDTVKHVYKDMDAERAKRQGEIDTIEEYRRVDKLCPDFQKLARGVIRGDK